VFGTCFGDAFTDFHGVARRLAGALDLAGPIVTVSTACASSTNAIGFARDLLLRGHADVVVAGGADALLREAFAGFSALGVLSASPCAPFSEPEGTTLAEGAGFLVLERASDVGRRGGHAWATIHGYGLSSDGFHETAPDPSGAGLERALRGALGDARWGADRIDFVSAHATGTANNDRVEWSVIDRVLGATGAPPMVAASKSQVGHAQGAAGVVELIVALICHREGAVPPTLHFRGPRVGCPVDPVAGSRPRALRVVRGLKVSSAFGGANAVLAYGDAPMAVGPSTPPIVSSLDPIPQRRAECVVLDGVGVATPAGVVRDPVAKDLAGVERGSEGSTDLRCLGVDARRLDPSSRWLTAAAVLALGRERRSLASAEMARTGLFVGATRMPDASARRCRESMRLRGIGAAAAPAFARMSVNAPAGACARALGLLGPTTMVSIGEGSGLLAVVLAADWLSHRDDADGLVAGGVDERPKDLPNDDEGAACVYLSRGRARTGAAVVAGWGVAGPGDPEGAVEAAGRGRSLARTFVVDDRTALRCNAEASRSVAAAALAVACLRSGDVPSALVIAARGNASVALYLERVPA
jgi:3-oxoacyl-[acyl-carrier-protein] synthase II